MVEAYCLSSNYCKNKRGIVCDDEYASWEYADVMFILCHCKYKRGIVGDDEYASWEYADVMFILCFCYDVMVIIYFDEFSCIFSIG